MTNHMQTVHEFLNDPRCGPNGVVIDRIHTYQLPQFWPVLNGPRYSHTTNPFVRNYIETGQNSLLMSYDRVILDYDIVHAYEIMRAFAICAPFFDRYALPDDRPDVHAAM